MSPFFTLKESRLLTSDAPAPPLGPVYLGFLAAGVGVVVMILKLPVSGSVEVGSRSLILSAFGVLYWLVTDMPATVASTLLYR